MESNKINADKALEISSEISVLTTGISMRPMLREHRDIAIIERVDRKLKKNEVPLYKREGCDKFVLHRILKVTENGYIIRGDNLYRNEYVVDQDIIGVLKAFYREGKYIDCNTNKMYKVYILLNRISYPLRFLWAMKLRPILLKIKRFIRKNIRKK